MNRATVRAREIALGLWAASLGVTLICVVFVAMSWELPIPDSWGFRGFTIIFAVLFSTIGMLIARRHPGDPIGWILLVMGVLGAVQTFADEYLIAASFVWPGALPAAAYIGWLNVWIWVPAVVLVPVAILYFPDGRLLSPRWRWALALAAVATVVTVVTAVLDPDQVTTNMRGVPGFYDPRAFGPIAQPVRALFGVGFGLVGLLMLVAIASVVLRFRRATGAQRQQIKWLAYATSILGVTLLLNVGVPASWVTPDPVAFAPAKILQYSLIAGMACVPIGLAIAILRHRLYDIDRLIDRTIVYGTVSVVLGGVYVLGVVSMQALLRGLHDDPAAGASELAVAVSTLVVVALFQPIRSRVQDAVDRRFYRSRYDAARTLDRFADRLRDHLDLEQLRGDLLRVVDDTIRPAHASVWLRRPER